MGFEATLWRSIAVYRVAALLYAGVLIGLHHPEYAHPLGGWLVFGAMTAWTAFAVYAYRYPGRHGWPLLSADLAVAVGCLLATGWVESLGRLMLGAPNLPASWVASPVLAWAVAKGRRSGAIAAGLVALADFLLHSALAEPNQGTFNGAVLLLLAGLVLGEYRRLAAAPVRTGADAPRLTDRETEILRYVAKGLSYKQVAERLVLSHRTVQNHVQNTLNKLQLHNRVELVRYAIEQGLDDG
jgi:DNA-binding CsgD family transcriptional regulator